MKGDTRKSEKILNTGGINRMNQKSRPKGGRSKVQTVDGRKHNQSLINKKKFENSIKHDDSMGSLPSDDDNTLANVNNKKMNLISNNAKSNKIFGNFLSPE